MEYIMIILSGCLITFGVYLMLSKSLLRVILGTGLFAHGANLLLLTAGSFKNNTAALLNETSTNYVDPLPQALILTAIVIGFAVTGFLLIIAIKNYQLTASDDITRLEKEDE